MAVFSTHGPQCSPPKISRKLWVSLYFSLLQGFHNLRWWRALFGIAWPFYLLKALLQFHCLQFHLITAEANLLHVSMKPMCLCGISLHHTMAGVNLSASPVTKWPTQAAGQSQSKAGWMVSLLAAGLSLAFPFSEQNRKLLPFFYFSFRILFF